LEFYQVKAIFQPWSQLLCCIDIGMFEVRWGCFHLVLITTTSKVTVLKHITAFYKIYDIDTD